MQRGASQTLEFRNNFRIDGGVNDVYLTSGTGRPGGGDLNLGNLRSRSGAQSYEIPGDGTGYRYVLIWCRPFQVPIGLGELR